MTKTVAIIGAGRVGSSLGYLLARAGYTVTVAAARTGASSRSAREFIGSGDADAGKAAEADIVFITTQDRAIRDACETLSRGAGFKRGAVVVHMSGAHTLDLLASAREAGAHRAVIHPLQSVPSREQGIRNLPGSYFRIEADPEALQTARDLVRDLGGKELALPGWTSTRGSAALYHAGAVTVSNYFVALVDLGLRFYEALGADRKQALEAVLPLIRGTLENIGTLGVPAALTGPIARGDVDTVRGHLAAISERAPELERLYRALAEHTVSVARAKGLDEKKAEELLDLLRTTT